MNTSSLPVIATASITLLVGAGVGFLAGRQSGREAALAELATSSTPNPLPPAEQAARAPESTGPSGVVLTPQAPHPASPGETPPVIGPGDVDPVDPPAGQPRIHKVKSGDMLGKLAIRYKVKVADIKKANNLRSDNIKVGQVLTIPPPDESSPSPGSETTEVPPPVPTTPQTPEVVVAPGPSEPSPGRVTITPPGPITEATPVTPAAPVAPASPQPPEPATPPSNISEPPPTAPEIASPPSPAPTAPPPVSGPDTLRLTDTTPSTPPPTAKPVAKIGTIPVEHQQMFTNTAGVGMRWDAATKSWRSMRDMKDEAEAVAKATEWNEQVPGSPHELSAKAANYHYEASGTRILLLPPGGVAPPIEAPARPEPAPTPPASPPSAGIPGPSHTPVSAPPTAITPRPAPAPKALIPLPKTMEKNFIIRSDNIGVTMAWDKERRLWRSVNSSLLNGQAPFLAGKLNAMLSSGAGKMEPVERAARSAGYLYEAEGPNRLVLSLRP